MSEAAVGIPAATASLPSSVPTTTDANTHPSTPPHTSADADASASTFADTSTSTSAPDDTSTSKATYSSSSPSSSSSALSPSSSFPHHHILTSWHENLAAAASSTDNDTDTHTENTQDESATSSPIVDFKLESGHHSEQGTRPTMEDEVLICDSFDVGPPSSSASSTSTSASTSTCTSTPLAVTSPLSFYGVFDGHGGKQAAVFTRERIHNNIIKQLQQGKHPTEALNQAYLQTDQEFIEQCRDTSGTTAVCILIEHSTRRLWVANVGDSRAVLCRKGTVLALTRDHKADRPDEVERIRKAGGFVVHKRVMGELAISRAIGDIDFKEKGFLFVLADPEIGEHELTSDDEFVLIACDGLYDVMSNEAACEFIRNSFRSGATPDEAAQQIVQHAISTLHTRDNVTVVIVRIKQPHQHQRQHQHEQAHEQPQEQPHVIAVVNSPEQQPDMKEEIVNATTPATQTNT